MKQFNILFVYDLTNIPKLAINFTIMLATAVVVPYGSCCIQLGRKICETEKKYFRQQKRT